MTGFIQSVASHSLKNHFILDAYPFLKCLMFACFHLSVVSNFIARSALQKNQIGGLYRTVLAIKMRGPDIMRAGKTVEGYVERQHKKRQIFILERAFFYK